MNKRQISIIFGVTLMLCPNAQAANINGFYVGGHLGLAYLNGIHRYTNGPVGENETKIAALGHMAGGQAGYTMELGTSKTIVGAELYYSFASPSARKTLQIKGSPVEGNVTLHHKGSMGAALIAGVLMNPQVVMYGMLAYDSSSYDLKYKELTFGTQSSESYNKKINGFVPGAGLMYRWTEHLLLGLRYCYVFSGKVEPRTEKETINGAVRGYNFQPREHRLTAQVSYKF